MIFTIHAYIKDMLRGSWDPLVQVQLTQTLAKFLMSLSIIGGARNLPETLTTFSLVNPSYKPDIGNRNAVAATDDFDRAAEHLNCEAEWGS